MPRIFKLLSAWETLSLFQLRATLSRVQRHMPYEEGKIAAGQRDE